MKRRSFLDFVGKGVIYTSLLPPFISSCNRSSTARYVTIDKRIKGISPSTRDTVVLADGLDWDVLIRYGDKISKADTFGFNNDYLAFLPGADPDSGILWANHEYVHPMFVSNYVGGAKSREQVDEEMYNVGGSIMRVKREKGKWKIERDNDFNKRITAKTTIPFNWHEPIYHSTTAMGTVFNCAGGVTPWGTILTCEENYDSFYKERDFETGRIIEDIPTLGWGEYYDNPPEHYGWVVEVDPMTGEAQKHIALGRCAHECATTVELEDKRVVVYTGDDRVDQCIYKFVSDEPGSLRTGKLYVADVDNGTWRSLDFEDNPVLRTKFKNQTEVLIRLREAARLVGGTPLARPEDIEIDPVTGHVLVALTNNIPRGNYFGEILKIEEADGKFDSLSFKGESFIAGGEETGFACPDNLAFDTAGNLWFTSDISCYAAKKDPYTPFGNNGLFVMPRQGPQEGKVIQIASAPNDAEFTGPFFAPDGKTLFLSVQHPGETSRSMNSLTSHWPGGGENIPKPSVITISGPLLEQIQDV